MRSNRSNVLYSGFNPLAGSTPPGVRLLLIVNVGLFLFTSILPINLANPFFDIFAFWPYLALPRLMVWQFVTYMFLHANFAHIFFNMFTLWMFGRRLEYRWGTKEFLRFFLICGVGAALGHMVAAFFMHISRDPIVGASGGIMGLLVAYALLYGEDTVYVYFVLPMKMKYFVIILGVLDALQVGGTSIAHFAHLGGLATGYIYLRWRYPGGPSLLSMFGFRQRRVVRRPFMRDNEW